MQAVRSSDAVAVASGTTASEEGTGILQAAVREPLGSSLSDLRDFGCCSRCCLRLCGSSAGSLSTAGLERTQNDDPGTAEMSGDQQACSVCLGVLQSVEGPLEGTPSPLLEAMQQESGQSSCWHGLSSGSAEAIADIIRYWPEFAHTLCQLASTAC